MSRGGPLNLSLLSRGVGAVKRNGQEKVEVVLEPSDYYNFATERPFFLPPLQPGYQYEEAGTGISHRESYEISLPKTFTTRKGALLLFSEDLALKNTNQEQLSQRHRYHARTSLPSQSLPTEEAVVLRTVDDLAKSILRYGSRDLDEQHNRMYLKFIHRRQEQWERQIRPGYSAKRYLSTWTRTWNDQIFDAVVSKGYLTERSLFHYNVLVPHLRKHLFHEDLSNMPQPYRLMKSMLLSPGSLSGYTFYRSPTSSELGAVPEEFMDGITRHNLRPDTKQSIRVIQTTKDGVQKEVSYSSLDREAQREVITDLLVKSAVHYALSKQEEIIEETINMAIKTEQDNTIRFKDRHQMSSAQRSIHAFDMRDAVESLLDFHRGPFVLGGDLPDTDARSHSSEHTGSFKGGSVPQHAARGMGGHSSRSSWSTGMEESSREYIGGLPVAVVKEVSLPGHPHQSPSPHLSHSLPHLPHIKAPLSPIHDVSREVSQLVTLPPIRKRADDHLPTLNVMPATPRLASVTTYAQSQSDLLYRDHRSHRSVSTVDDGQLDDMDEEERHTTRSQKFSRKGLQDARSLAEKERELADISAYHQSTDNVHYGRSGPKGRFKTPQPPKHKSRSLVAGSGTDSLKGSMIMAPDGEIISVGGSIGPFRSHDVGVISDVTLPQARDVNMTDDSGLSDDEPDVWKSASKDKKHSLSSKKSDSLKLHIAKRENDTDSLASSSLQTETPSSDIDSKMSIHSQNKIHSKAKDERELTLVKMGNLQNSSVSIGGASQPQSSVTEQELLETLTEHAKLIANSVLSQNQSGQDLETDVRNAADMWMESHPARNISRSQSVQDAARAKAIEDVMNAQRANSAGPSAAEYKELIRQSLSAAVAMATGLSPDDIPEDAEISHELLEALVNQKLTPEDIAIIRDEETGKAVIKSRSEIAQALGGVAEGHIYLIPSSKGGSHSPSESGGAKRHISIPADRSSVADNIEYGVISYGGGNENISEQSHGRSKAGSKTGSIAGGINADIGEGLQQMTEQGEIQLPEEVDEFQKALKQMEEKQDGASKVTSLQSSLEHGAKELASLSSISPAEGGLQSETSGKIRKIESSDENKKRTKTKSMEEKEGPFVVGMVDHTDEMAHLYGGKLPPKTDSANVDKSTKSKEKKHKKGAPIKKVEDKKKGKGKKTAKKAKKEEDSSANGQVEPLPEAPPAVADSKLPLSPSAAPKQQDEDEPPLSSPDAKTDDDMEFNIIREEFSPEPERPTKVNIPEISMKNEEDIDMGDEPADEEDEDSNLKSITNREARAAKRAAAAAKRKEEVERKRREREEQIKREKEEQERQEQLKREMEEERKRKEEERRLRKLQEQEIQDKEEQERMEAERRQKAEQERERRAKEEFQRKLEEMKRKQAEEEARRNELLLQQQKEEEERRLQEELKLSLMAEQERAEYLRRKKEEEELERQKEEEARRKREEEAKKALEEAKRLAEEMLRKKAELEARLKFNRSLRIEASGLDHTQDINRAFVFSYYELLQWLGLDIPEFELAKMSQF